MKRRTRQIGGALLKIGVTFAIVLTVAGSVVTLSPSSDEKVGVNSSRADILWMTESARSNTERFASALDDLGHSAPRVYDVNGNTLYSSERVSRKSPAQILRAYQHEFVEQGVNSRAHTTSRRTLAALEQTESVRKRIDAISEAAMNGEIVPTSTARNVVSMSGVLLETKAGSSDAASKRRQMTAQLEGLSGSLDDLEAAYRECDGDPRLIERPTDPRGYLNKTSRQIERAASGGSGNCGDTPKLCSRGRFEFRSTAEKLQAYVAAIEDQPALSDCPAIKRVGLETLERSAETFAHQIDAIRSIRAVRDQESGATHVTAIWSERGFDMESMSGDSQRTQRRSRRRRAIPLCESCEDTWDFGGNGAEQAYASTVAHSSRAPQRVVRSYGRLLSKRGWQLHGAGEAYSSVYRAIGLDPPEARWLRFSRGERHLTVRIRPLDGRTEVTAFRSK